MNIQDLINELTKYADKYKKSTIVFNAGKSEAYSTALGLAKKVKAHQQPVVKPFVADWFEENKTDLEYEIWFYIRKWDEQNTESEFHQWFEELGNKAIETLIRMQDGYEVEKKPLYYVRFRDLNSYFVKFINCEFSAVWDEDMECATPFNDKAKADAVATLANCDTEVVEG